MFKRFKVNGLFILLSLTAFEMIMFSSTRQGILSMLGQPTWATTLAFAFVAVDFAGVGLLFFGGNSLSDRDNSVWMVTGAWLITAFGDTYMTYFNVASSMLARTNHIMVTSGIISVEAFTKTIPALVAAAIWLAQVGLVHSLNMAVAELMSGGRRRNTGNGETFNRKNKGKNNQTPPVYDFRRSGK